MPYALIQKLQRFTLLSQEDKATLIGLGSLRVKHFLAREDIIQEGERPAVINLVLSGWAHAYKTLEDGRRQTTAYLLPGDLCDFNAFVVSEMDHSIGAITPVKVAELPRRTLDELMLSHPQLAQALWWESLVSAAIQREWTVNLGQRDAMERVAHLLCELFIRLEAVGLTRGDECDLPLTQTELGEATGLSTVHVNRTLQDLRAANLIVLKDRTLTIPDREALQRRALFNPNYLHLEREQLDVNVA